MHDAFWTASREMREAFELAAEPASDERVIENRVDLQMLLGDSAEQREGVRLKLFDIFDKAHQVLMRDKEAMKPSAQAMFRELAFWNTIRIVAGFTVSDMAKSAQAAQRAVHAEAVWPRGMTVRPREGGEFVPASQMLAQILPQSDYIRSGMA